MANFNKVILLGNLTRDPQLKYLPSQTPVVEIGLAVSNKYKTASGEEREEVLFIDCNAFGKTAETINQYCQKGRPLLIEGRLKLDTWDDKQTGQKRSKHKVHIDSFTFVGSRDGGGGASGGGGAGAGSGDRSQGDDQRPAERAAPRNVPQQAAARPAPEAPFDDSQQFKDDDIPF